VPGSGSSPVAAVQGRGFSCDRLIYDEAYELPEETIAASLPTMSARPNPHVIYASSAALDKSVTLRRVMARGRREDDRPADDGLCYLEWSADPKCDLDDRDEWVRANPATSTRSYPGGLHREGARGDV
jgi:phage terminase large subunit-like protein